MDKNESMLKKQAIIGNQFLLTNKLQAVMDNLLAPYGVTARQWFLTAVLEELFNNPPTLSELSDAMNTSRQNVKQLVDILEKKTLLEMETDEQDRRAVRVKLTDKYYLFSKQIQEEGDSFLNEIFEDLNDQEIDTAYSVIIKLSSKLEDINKKFK